MKDFKTYYEETLLNEYGKQEPWLYANSTSAKHHSKSMMRGDRKHQNLLRKDYQAKNAIVRDVMKTKGEKMLKGAILTNLLKDYSMEFGEGLKGLGKGVKIFMYLDNQGEQVGVVCHRDKCSKYEAQDNS